MQAILKLTKVATEKKKKKKKIRRPPCVLTQRSTVQERCPRKRPRKGAKGPLWQWPRRSLVALPSQ
jgi:hypothetical protein